MKKGQAILLIINIVLIVFALFNIISGLLSTYALVLFLFVTFFVLIKYFGFEKNKRHYQKYILLSVLISWFAYTTISYLFGLSFLGFLVNPLSMNPLKIASRTIPILLIIPLLELIRYVLVTKGRNYKKIHILTVISFTLIDISMVIKIFNLSNSKAVLELVLTIMTLSSKNIFLTYESYKTDYRIPIIYRFLMEIPVYVLPRFPNLGEYVDTVIQFLLPILLIYLTHRSLKIKPIERAKPKNKVRQRIGVGAFTLFIVLFVGITCGWFKYYTLAIGSGSMSPNIDKGDIVVVKKLSKKELNQLKVNDVLVFKYESTVIVHRIIKIENSTYYTKGDANNHPDDYPILETDVLGIAVRRIPIIGRPIIWLNELLKK